MCGERNVQACSTCKRDFVQQQTGKRTCAVCLVKQRLKARARRSKEKQENARSALPRNRRVESSKRLCKSCKRLCAENFRTGYKTCVRCTVRKSLPKICAHECCALPAVFCEEKVTGIDAGVTCTPTTATFDQLVNETDLGYASQCSILASPLVFEIASTVW